MTRNKVICIGEALVDQIISKSDNENINNLGGAPANVACALSKLKIQSSFIGNIGNDSFGLKFLKLFRELEIDTTCLQIDKKYMTRIVKVLTDKNGDRSFSGFVNNKFDYFADETLDMKLLEKDINPLIDLYSHSKFIVTGTLLLASLKSAESIYFLLNLAKKYEIKIVIDLNWREVFWNNSFTMRSLKKEDKIKKIKEFLYFADILKLSQEEADIFFVSNSPLEISKSFPNSPDVVITNGGDPIKWFIDGYEGIADIGYSGQIIDTTGAGDAFLAGLISQLIDFGVPKSKSDIQKSIKFAGACGFLTCQGQGAIKPQPTFEHVQEFLCS